MNYYKKMGLFSISITSSSAKLPENYSKINILYVEDELPFAIITKKLLEEVNSLVNIDMFTSPIEALNSFTVSDYDIVLSDYEMPELNGIQLLKEIRKIDSSVPFILFTGHNRTDINIEVLNTKMDFYLKKNQLSTQLSILELNLRIIQIYSVIKFQQDVKQLLKFLQLILIDSPTNMAIVDLKIAKIIFVNDPLCKLFGYSNNEIIGKDWAFFTYKEDLPVGLRASSNLYSRKTDIVNVQKRYIHKEGFIINCQVSSALISDKDEKPLFFITSLQEQAEISKLKEVILHQQTLFNKYTNYLIKDIELVFKSLKVKFEEFSQNKIDFVELASQVNLIEANLDNSLKTYAKRKGIMRSDYILFSSIFDDLLVNEIPPYINVVFQETPTIPGLKGNQSIALNLFKILINYILTKCKPNEIQITWKFYPDYLSLVIDNNGSLGPPKENIDVQQISLLRELEKENNFNNLLSELGWEIFFQSSDTLRFVLVIHYLPL
jgi:PAS domain S-box-containing protein